MTRTVWTNQCRDKPVTIPLFSWERREEEFEVWFWQIRLCLHEGGASSIDSKLWTRLVAYVAHVDTWMILEILTNAREIPHNTNPKCLQLLSWPDTREQEQLRGIDGPAREDDLFVYLLLMLSTIFEIGNTD